MLKNSQKVDSFSVMAKISHELRNPIHGIKGICSALHDNWDFFDEQTKKSSLDIIYKAARELETLVDNLFNSKEEISCKLENGYILPAVQQAIDTVNLFKLPENKIGILLECCAEQVQANLDSFWIGQVLNNLLYNSLKHSRGTSIKIKIDSSEKEIIISVIDDGVGVPESELEVIFAPFKQSSTTGSINKGSGLGLTICQQVIAAHNGKIWAANNPQGGLNISFTLQKISY